jgi:hypothetical protein
MNTRTVSQALRRRPVFLVVGVIAMAMVVGSAHADKPTAAQKCAAAKRKLVGKRIAALTACDATAVARGVDVDPTCTAKATTRFTTAWGKAESTADGACITTGDVTTIGIDIDAHADDLAATLGLAGGASKCTAGLFKAAGKDDGCELGCQAQAATRGAVVDELCLATCTTKFTSACAKSESKEVCHNAVDCAAFAATMDTFVARVAAALPATPTSTSSSTTISSSTTTVTSSSTTTTTIATVACGTFITKWGSLGSGNGQFNDPELLAVDAAGNVFVPDASNDRIQKFTSDGTFITAWGSPGVDPGQFTGPEGVAVDGAGNVFVADTGANRIQKFTNTGSFITTWGSVGAADGELSGPNAVAVDANGNVFVADRFNNRIQKFTTAGAFVTAWGSVGAGDGQFTNPVGIAVDRDLHVFVTDFFNDRIQKFTDGGGFLGKWGATGGGDGEFIGARAVAVDANGHVFAVDDGHDRVEVFTDTGTFLAAWGSLGLDDGQFNSATGAAVGANGEILVTDEGNRVQRFACPSPNGGDAARAPFTRHPDGGSR